MRLSDAEYDEFMDWLSGKEFSYETKVERRVEELIKTAKTEKRYAELRSTLDKLASASGHNTGKDLITFKEEILMLLEQEIAGRYFFEKGVIESALGKDDDVLTAIQLLNDPTRYNAILDPG